jgi:hypothetical protein
LAGQGDNYMYGHGEFSEPITVISSGIPDAITDLSIAETHGTSLLLSFTEPNNQGKEIQSFRIYQSSDDITYGQIGLSGDLIHYSFVSNTIVSVTGLTLGQTYYFKAIAVNDNGISLIDNSNSVSYTSSISPSSVRNVVVDAYNSSINLEWQPPAISGGISYTYTILVNNGDVYSLSNYTETFLTISNLTNGTAYNLEIYADNGVDTDYNIYYFSATPIASPIAITNLSSYTSSGALVLTWSYVDVYDTNYFFVSLFDKTLDIITVITIKPSDVNLILNSNIYSFVLNQYTTQLPAFQTSDSLKIVAFSENDVGVSPLSNVISIN